MLEAIHELQLRSQAAVGPVVHISSDEKRVYLFPDAQVDDVFKGVEGGAMEGLGYIFRSLGPNAPEWAVQMQVGGVYEADLRHKDSVQRSTR